MKNYIVYETYAFGVNYFDKSGRVVPDYTIKDNQIPTMDENAAKVIAERGNRHIKAI